MVSVVKQMENNPRNVVGKEGEMRLIQTEMYAELAEQIMRRIAFFAASSQPQPNSP
jgi:LPS-assembly lipoprotein